jgi:hypothetical protein
MSDSHQFRLEFYGVLRQAACIMASAALVSGADVDRMRRALNEVGRRNPEYNVTTLLLAALAEAERQLEGLE